MIEVDENVDDVAIEVELVIADEGAPDVGAPDVGVAVVSADVQNCGLKKISKSTNSRAWAYLALAIVPKLLHSCVSGSN